MNETQRIANLERRIASLEKRLSGASVETTESSLDEVVIPIQLDQDANLPAYANLTDAGADIYANEDMWIAPHQTKILKTGIRLAIPPGYEVQIRPRSGISLKTSLRIPNSPGTIDTGYRDEVGVIVYNEAVRNNSIEGCVDIKLNPVEAAKGYPKGTYYIKKGDRIAQMVVAKVCHAKFEQVDDVSKIGTNRGGGFGHSGV